MHGPRRSMVHKCQLVSSLAAHGADAGSSRSSRFLNDSCVSTAWSIGETYFCVKQISSFQSGLKPLHWPCASWEEEHQDQSQVCSVVEHQVNSTHLLSDVYRCFVSR